MSAYLNALSEETPEFVRSELVDVRREQRDPTPVPDDITKEDALNELAERILKL